ncbi:hypothetical protein ACH5RR_030118 [Cinchona calisaya]|uniref:Uncharacterized protein n=1 Tax=Cinchona calisaya TaxID=153742 RepID=A0ABD2YTQ2_9GENT
MFFLSHQVLSFQIPSTPSSSFSILRNVEAEWIKQLLTFPPRPIASIQIGIIRNAPKTFCTSQSNVVGPKKPIDFIIYVQITPTHWERDLCEIVYESLSILEFVQSRVVFREFAQALMALKERRRMMATMANIALVLVFAIDDAMARKPMVGGA